MPQNNAAWVDQVGARCTIRSAPYTPPLPHQLVVKTHAWSVCPADNAVQDSQLFTFLTYPLILGCDIAGIVHEVGSNITGFTPGDRVFAMSEGTGTGETHKGGFQDYVVVEEQFVGNISAQMMFKEVVIFGLNAYTASSALYMPTETDGTKSPGLGMRYPTQPLTGEEKTLLVWGGASSVGCNAIQLAVASGYRVVATSSPRNHALLKSLGASQVFDYNSPSIIEDLVGALSGADCVGILQAAGAFKTECVNVAAKLEQKVVVLCKCLPPKKEDVPEGVECYFSVDMDVKGSGIGRMLFNEFLPRALEEGSYEVAPEPWVVEKGLESLQLALDKMKEGVSAKKLVVVRD